MTLIVTTTSTSFSLSEGQPLLVALHPEQLTIADRLNWLRWLPRNRHRGDRRLRTLHGALSVRSKSLQLVDRERLGGGEFWGEGYFVTTVGQQGNEPVSATDIRKQGQEQDYKQFHKQPWQLELVS